MTTRRYHHPRYGARSPRAFWTESALIAIIVLTFLAALVAILIYA